MKEELFPITVGGDHSVSIPAVLASSKVNIDIGLILIGAHTNYHTFETTVSGNLEGLTTAATLWICAAIGMAAGCGEFALSISTTFFAIIALVLIRFVEKKFIHNSKNADKQRNIKCFMSFPHKSTTFQKWTKSGKKIHIVQNSENC